MTITKFDIPLKPYTTIEEREAIEALLADDWTVMHVSTYWYNNEQYERWTLHKPDDNSESVKADDLVLTIINSVEGKSGYSKTHRTSYNFYKCELISGEILNIHDHPDTDRNTYHLVQKTHWDKWFPPIGETDYNLTIPVVVRKNADGWWELVKIVKFSEYQAVWEIHPETMQRIIDAEKTSDDISSYEVPEKADDDDDDSWRDSATSAAIDNLNAGIDFDEDDYPAYYIDGEVFTTGKHDTDHAAAPDDSDTRIETNYFSRECSMCGKDKPLNQHGRCSSCQTIWDS